jgi:hypothetical protein
MPEFANMNMCAVEQWLNTPNQRFGGKSSLEALCEEGSKGAKRVAYELEQIELNSAQVRQVPKDAKKRRTCARSGRTLRP